MKCISGEVKQLYGVKAIWGDMLRLYRIDRKVSIKQYYDFLLGILLGMKSRNRKGVNLNWLTI